MAGNVFQWTGSWFERYPGNSLNDKANAYGQKYREARGGTWYSYNPRDLRGALRFRFPPGYRNYSIGFRVARTP